MRLVRYVERALDETERLHHVALADQAVENWPALRWTLQSSYVSAICCIVVDTLGRIYRTAQSATAQQKSCFGEYTGRISFPQAWARALAILERQAGIEMHNDAIVGISAPQLVVIDDYAKRTPKGRSFDAYKDMGR